MTLSHGSIRAVSKRPLAWIAARYRGREKAFSSREAVHGVRVQERLFLGLAVHDMLAACHKDSARAQDPRDF